MEAYSWGVGEDESGDGLYCGFEGVVGAAVIGVENTPGLEVRNDTFNKGAVDDVLADLGRGPPCRAPGLGGPRRSRGCRPPPLVRWWIGRPFGCRPATPG